LCLKVTGGGRSPHRLATHNSAERNPTARGRRQSLTDEGRLTHWPLFRTLAAAHCTCHCGSCDVERERCIHRGTAYKRTLSCCAQTLTTKSVSECQPLLPMMRVP
jgi:hypothetical protein